MLRILVSILTLLSIIAITIRTITIEINTLSSTLVEIIRIIREVTATSVKDYSLNVDRLYSDDALSVVIY